MFLPTERLEKMALVARQTYNCGYGYSYYNSGYCYSGWNSYGRWIFLAAVIVFALLVFFLFSCITARRRRRMGYAPYRGTAWAAGRTPAGHGAAQYNAQPQYGNGNQPVYNNSNNPPPAYQAENAGYYGANNNIELQQPQAAYKPPQGPPPGR